MPVIPPSSSSARTTGNDPRYNSPLAKFIAFDPIPLCAVSGRFFRARPSGLVWFITGDGKHLYVRDVGAAPLQRHPMVAVALVRHWCA